MTNLKNNLNQTLDFSNDHQTINFLDNYVYTPYDVLNSIGDLIVLYNAEFEVIWSNKKAQEVFSGFKKRLDKAKCHHICTSVTYCDKCSVRQAFETKHVCENQVFSNDGKQWMVTALPLTNEQKEITGILEIRKYISGDVNLYGSKTKNAEQANHSTLLQNNIHVRLDAQGRCLYASPSFRNMLHDGFREITEEFFETFVNEEDVLLTRNVLEQIKHPPYVTHFECRMLTKKGIQWFSWRGEGSENGNGDTLSFVFYGQNISKQKAVEEELRQKNKAYEKLNEQLIRQNENYDKITRELLKRNNQIEDLYDRLKESEERFRNMFIKHSSVMFLFDPESYEIIDANIAAQHYYGYTEHEFLTKSLMDINVIDKAEIQQRFNKANERQHQCVPFKHKLATGKIRDVEVYSVPILFKDEEVSFSIVYDVTKRKKAEKKLTESEKKLKQANDSKDKFFSIIAHDLKNPFNSLIGLTDFITLNGQNISNDQLHELVRTMGEVSRQGYNLLDNLLQWSRTQMGNLKVSIEPVAMDQIINENIALLKNNATTKGVTFSLEGCSDCIALADSNMIATVVRNLLANAIKYSYRNGIIKIHCSKSDGEVVVSVIDNGKGIETEDLDKLFRIDENFTTLGTEKEMGTGLGLILCKEFVDRCKGKLIVNSQPGVGSEFVFSLPKAE